MLIAICGYAGSGKDTTGDYLIKKYNFQKDALANPIKRLVQDIFVLDKNTVHDRILREQQLKEWPDWTVRKLLQFIGTEMFRTMIDPDIWVKSLWLRIVKDKDINWVVTDVRFPNEKNILSAKSEESNISFYMFRIKRPGYDGKTASGLKGHASEAYDLEGDYVLENNGTIEDLYGKIDSVMTDVIFDDLHKPKL